MIRQYGAQRCRGGNNPLRVGVVAAGTIVYLQDREFFDARHGGQAVCRVPWQVEAFLNGTVGAARRNRVTGLWESTFWAGRSDMAVVRSLRDHRQVECLPISVLWFAQMQVTRCEPQTRVFLIRGDIERL